MSSEWHTPSKYIEAARKVMGSIDLDTASCIEANRTVKATQYYTKEKDGLRHPWHGNVWCNPPYGKVNPIPGSTKSYQKLFVERTIQEYNQQNIDQAILLLLGNSCFTHYFTPLWEYPLCFHDGYISFDKLDGSRSDFGFGTIFAYLGPNIEAFIEHFSPFGRIVKTIDVPKVKETHLSLWEVSV